MANSIAVPNFYHRGRRRTQRLSDPKSDTPGPTADVWGPTPAELLLSFHQKPGQFPERVCPLAEAVQFGECLVHQRIRLAFGSFNSE